MTARIDVASIAGAILSISADLPVTYDQAGYIDTGMDWTAIGKVENYGNHGGTANITPFTPVDSAQTTKVKGHKDYGMMALIIGSIPSNAGQVILAAAFESNNHYSAKLVYPDGETHYMDTLIGKHEFQDGSVDDISRIAVDLHLCQKPVYVAAV